MLSLQYQIDDDIKKKNAPLLGSNRACVLFTSPAMPTPDQWPEQKCLSLKLLENQKKALELRPGE